MADLMPIEEIANEMYKIVADFQGKKKLKAYDLTKAMVEKYGDKVDKQVCKQALRTLMDTGRCIYTYFGGSFVEIPPDKV